VTVCIAVLFSWNFNTSLENPRFGKGAITASDRMITAADVQYEPQQTKAAYFGKSMLLVAGDMAIHSQAIADAEKEVRGRDLPPHDIARIYGRCIQAINRHQAETEILAPLSLNTDTFLAQQKDFSHGFVELVTSQLQNRRPVDSEALIVGSDGENSHIYQIDSYGNDVCLDALGFGAIGIGAWHAKSRLMQIGHTSTRLWAASLASIFAAKKNAEIAPGVGTHTDMHAVLKDGPFQIWNHIPPELARLFQKYSAEVSKFGDLMVKELDEFLAKSVPESSNEATKNERPVEVSGQSQAIDVGATSDATEAARGNDDRQEDDRQKAAE
jgi:hypothetical protein